MKASELMIDDLVRVNKDVSIKKGTIVEVRAIDADREFHELKGCATCVPVDNHDGLSGGVWTEYLDPIPLTAEILEANGFKKCNFRDVEGGHKWSWWRDTDGLLWMVTLWCRELNDDPKDGWMIRIESGFAIHCHKVEFVHEVQHALRLLGIDKDFKLEG